MKEIGETLENARKAMRLTQTQAAEKLNVSERMYQRYEAGIFPKYKSDVIQRIDEVFHAHLHDMINANVSRGILTGGNAHIIADTGNTYKRGKNQFIELTVGKYLMQTPLIMAKARAGYISGWGVDMRSLNSFSREI